MVSSKKEEKEEKSKEEKEKSKKEEKSKEEKEKSKKEEKSKEEKEKSKKEEKSKEEKEKSKEEKETKSKKKEKSKDENKKRKVLKRRKILRDNIQGITKPAIQRILRRAGVKRISGIIYEEIRGILKSYLINIISGIVIFTEHERRKTVQKKDLELALDIRGIELAAGLNAHAKKTASLQSSNSRGKSGLKSAHKLESKSDKKHRFKPGTVALRNIRYQQKYSDCLAIPKFNFSRLVREIAQDFKSNIRFSGGVIDLLQLVTENHLVNLCSFANLCAIHVGRETLFPKDLQLVILIRGNT